MIRYLWKFPNTFKFSWEVTYTVYIDSAHALLIKTLKTNLVYILKVKSWTWTLGRINALISQNEETSKILIVLPYWLSLIALVIFLSFENFSLTLGLAKQFFLKHVKTRRFIERSTTFFQEDEIRTWEYWSNSLKMINNYLELPGVSRCLFSQEALS